MLKILRQFSMHNILKIFSTRLADQPRSYSRHPEAALTLTSLLHVHEPRSALWTVSIDSLATLCSLTRTQVPALRPIELGS
jgi:hypothetical protein